MRQKMKLLPCCEQCLLMARLARRRVIVWFIQESSLTDMLRHYEIQQCIDDVNLQVASEHNRL